MGPSVAVLDSMTFTFDAQEAIAMADPEKKPADGGTPEMTLTQLAELVKSFGPQIAAINEALAGLSKPAPAAVEDDPTAVPPKAAAAAPAAAAGAMDAALAPILATVAALSKSVAAMDAAIKAQPAAPTAASIGAEFAARDKLADRLAAVVGTFDATDKTLAQVAAYGAEKLGLKPTAGHELSAVDAYLVAAEARPVQTVRTGMDATLSTAGDNFVTRHLNPQPAK